MMGSKNKNLRKPFLILLIILLFINYLPSVCADDYYADITIDVDDSGFVTIDGITNHPGLLAEDTELYTSKKQSYWLLNITKDEVFSDFIYILTLPEGSSINYVKSSGSIRIEEDLGNLLVKGFGENKSFSVAVQYQIEKPSDNDDLMELDLPFILLVFIPIFVIISAFMFFKRLKVIKKSETTIDSIEEYNLKGLNERQKKIMNLLLERKTPLTQTDIQKELKIPKAAVSRNIRGLELKGLIEKENIGMSNLIRLKKP